MKHLTRASCAALCTWVACAAAGAGQGFAGWQAMRVIEQEGSPRYMRSADLDGDGRAELIVINSRQSRLDLYRWLKPDQRRAPGEADPDRPNELPMAPDFEQEEVVLDRLPRDVMAFDHDGDGDLELLTLELPPARVVLYGRADDGKWTELDHWDLLPGKPSGRDRLMRWKPTGGDGARTLLISYDRGIQELALAKGARPSWLEPREKRGRLDWWVADLDGDDDGDLVEWSRSEGSTIRWYENTGAALLPARGLTDVKVDGVAMLNRGERGGELLTLGGLTRGVLKRYGMTTGEPGPLGNQQPLPLPDGGDTPWAGITIEGQPAVVVVDPDQPRLMLYRKVAGGWSDAETYPAVSNIEAIVAPAARPGTLLIRTKDAADLHTSAWQDGRLTYPRLRRDAVPGEEPDKLIALGQAGETAWWVKRANVDLYLFTLKPGDDQPNRVDYPNNGGSASDAIWLGDTRLLVMDQFKRDPRLVFIDDEGKGRSRSPAHLKKTPLDEFRLVTLGERLRPARLTDGVLQWLDHTLQPTDQVMLPDGLKLSAFVPIDGDSAWALQSGGERVHRLKADAAGVMRVGESFELPGGKALTTDRVIGLVLTGTNRLIGLSPGEARELEVTDTLDSRTGRPSGVREATIHRVATADLTGDGADEVVLFDDRRHQVTLLDATGDRLEPLISWPVFEDKAYPYGDTDDDLTPEPRTVIGGDFDGDGRADLAMLCHDRLLIYLAKEGTK